MFFNTIHVVSFVQYTLEKRLSSCQNVCFAIGYPYFEHKTTYLWLMRSVGGGELSLSACLGWGIDHQERKKLQIPRGGGW